MKILAVQIALLVVFSSSCLFFATDAYEHVQSTIVSVLCLSCIKLEPKMVFSFAYEAYEGSFPDFVLENLSRGVVLLSYRTDACAACDRMEPIIASLFNLTSLDELLTTSKFDGVNVTLIHINLDHAEEELRNSYNVYNILGDRGGVPMFSIITYGRDRGVVKPAYATGYGFLGKPTPEQGKDILKQMIEKGIDLYIQNRPLVD